MELPRNCQKGSVAKKSYSSLVSDFDVERSDERFQVAALPR